MSFNDFYVALPQKKKQKFKKWENACRSCKGKENGRQIAENFQNEAQLPDPLLKEMTLALNVDVVEERFNDLCDGYKLKGPPASFKAYDGMLYRVVPFDVAKDNSVGRSNQNPFQSAPRKTLVDLFKEDEKARLGHPDAPLAWATFFGKEKDNFMEKTGGELQNKLPPRQIFAELGLKDFLEENAGNAWCYVYLPKKLKKPPKIPTVADAGWWDAFRPAQAGAKHGWTEPLDGYSFKRPETVTENELLSVVLEDVGRIQS